jgi:hypothetical protein
MATIELQVEMEVLGLKYSVMTKHGDPVILVLNVLANRPVEWAKLESEFLLRFTFYSPLSNFQSTC